MINWYDKAGNLSEKVVSEFRGTLLAWYDQKGRTHLPWRTNTLPYHVWISEIMLQQTQVETVIPYYERFLSELPDVSALASVEEDRLLKLWEGLGYYNRARNLKAAACQIMEQYLHSITGTKERFKYAITRKRPG